MAEKCDTIIVVYDTKKENRPRKMIIPCANLTDNHEDQGTRGSKLFGKLNYIFLNEIEQFEMLIV